MLECRVMTSNDVQLTDARQYLERRQSLPLIEEVEARTLTADNLDGNELDFATQNGLKWMRPGRSRLLSTAVHRI